MEYKEKYKHQGNSGKSGSFSFLRFVGWAVICLGVRGFEGRWDVVKTAYKPNGTVVTTTKRARGRGGGYWVNPWKPPRSARPGYRWVWRPNRGWVQVWMTPRRRRRPVLVVDRNPTVVVSPAPRTGAGAALVAGAATGLITGLAVGASIEASRPR